MTTRTVDFAGASITIKPLTRKLSADVAAKLEKRGVKTGQDMNLSAIYELGFHTALAVVVSYVPAGGGAPLDTKSVLALIEENEALSEYLIEQARDLNDEICGRKASDAKN